MALRAEEGIVKAIRINGPHQVHLEEVPIPAPGAGEVLIRVRATGICGTDVEIVHGTMAYFTLGMAAYPVTPGHEWVGEVVDLGDGVHEFAIGDHVVGECSVGCRACDRCLSGNYHRCLNRTETGILNRDGGFAEYIVYPAVFLHRISADVDLRAAALVEPTAIAFNGVKNAKISPQTYLAIHGDGPIGLLVLLVARAFGAAKIALIGATPHRLKLARRLGADRVIDCAAEDVAGALLEFGGGALPDAAIEATGNPDAASTAIRTVAPGGRVVLQGLFGGNPLNGFDLDQIVINDLTVKGALGSPNIWPDVIRLIESGRVNPLAIVSAELPLDRFADGIGAVTAREEIKIVVSQEGASHHAVA